jgi:hypothetical protein
MMGVKLRNDDRRAIDLMLDNGHAAAAGTGSNLSSTVDGMNVGYLSNASPISQDSVQAVQTVLSLLSLLPVEEPPVGLVERTLARIDESVDAMDHAAYRPGIQIDPSMPSA